MDKVHKKQIRTNEKVYRDAVDKLSKKPSRGKSLKNTFLTSPESKERERLIKIATVEATKKEYNKIVYLYNDKQKHHYGDILPSLTKNQEEIFKLVLSSTIFAQKHMSDSIRIRLESDHKNLEKQGDVRNCFFLVTVTQL